jgi:hypothetical protein
MFEKAHDKIGFIGGTGRRKRPSLGQHKDARLLQGRLSVVCKTKEGKHMSEQDAIKEGDHAAPGKD